jgi:hypothetical protein
MRIHSVTRLAAGCLLCSAFATAQTTHVVGTGGFAQIRDALLVAAPGDFINVQSGTYAQFEMNVGVTLRAITPGAVSIAYDGAYFPPGCIGALNCPGEGPTKFNIPAGQTGHVLGLVFQPTMGSISGISVRHSVSVLGGRMTFEACEARAFDSTVFGASNAEIRLLGCTIIGQASVLPPPVASFFNSTVAAVDCTIRSLGGTFPNSISCAIRLENSTFVGSKLTVKGPDPLFGSVGGRAIDAVSGAFWISDSSLQAGNGACAFTGAAQRTIARCTVTQGGSNCATASTGPLLGIEPLGFVPLGGNYALRFRGTANGFVGVFAAPALGALAIPELVQPLHLDAANAFSAGLAPLDATGAAVLTWSIPSTPTVLGRPIWFQGFTGLVLPLQASAVAGGLVR